MTSMSGAGPLHPWSLQHGACKPYFGDMEPENRQLQTLSNSIFLAGTGLAVMIARRLLLAPVLRFVLAGVAVGWGFYLLGKNPYNKTPGWTSIAVGGGLALLGGSALIGGLSWLVGVGLIAGGAVSFFSGLFKKKDTM